MGDYYFSVHIFVNSAETVLFLTLFDLPRLFFSAGLWLVLFILCKSNFQPLNSTLY